MAGHPLPPGSHVLGALSSSIASSPFPRWSRCGSFGYSHACTKPAVTIRQESIRMSHEGSVRRASKCLWMAHPGQEIEPLKGVEAPKGRVNLPTLFQEDFRYHVITKEQSPSVGRLEEKEKK